MKYTGNISLVNNSYVERLGENLNNYFKTDKFIYNKETEIFFDDFIEDIEAIGFPSDFLNIKLYNEGTRIDFVLNLSQKNIEQLNS